ncbi:MAG: maleylacetoacetate isomerase [Hyphomicrobiales bacterium]|nr:maleylacetoacetate isomerase [Hyphomicrobiales bacterium]
MKLYTYFRSSAAYRVRIALNLKNIDHDLVPVHLVRDGGEHRKPDYLARNPQGRVPALTVSVPGGEETLIQSSAILEYLEEVYPDPPLLPGHPLLRAKVRAVAAIIASDVHPLNNSGTLVYMKSELGCDQDAIDRWYAHWITENFRAVEALIDGRDGFAFTDRPTFADLHIVPQVFNARRFNVPLHAFPKIVAVDAHCREIPAFEAAHPASQPDAE